MNLEALLCEQARAGSVSSIANPFVKGSVVRVTMMVGSWCLGSPIVFQATIYVQQGPTKGEHNIEGRDYPDLMTKLSATLESLQ